MQRLSATMLRLARIGWDFRQPELQVGNLEVVQETVERYEPLAEKEGMALLLEGGREHLYQLARRKRNDRQDRAARNPNNNTVFPRRP